jgi:hypothetical protein
MTLETGFGVFARINNVSAPAPSCFHVQTASAMTRLAALAVNTFGFTNDLNATMIGILKVPGDLFMAQGTRIRPYVLRPLNQRRWDDRPLHRYAGNNE